MRVADPTNTIKQQLHILRLLREHGPTTRRHLSELAGYSISLVGQLMTNLAARKFIEEDHQVTSDQAGRPSQAWTLGRDLILAVGLDVGSVSTRSTVLNARGDELFKLSVRTPISDSREHLLEHLKTIVHQTLLGANGYSKRIHGIGVAFSGFVDHAEGRSLDAPNIAHADALPIKSYLEKAFKLPVSVDDSSRAMAVAEQRYGVAKHARNVVCINVGAGIGTGILLEGQLYRGAMGLAGELGHIPMDAHGEYCRCGGRGCLETLASGSAILGKARKMMDMGVLSSLPQRLRGDMSRLTIQLIAQAAQEGDVTAIELLADAATWLGMGVATAFNLFSPELVVLGGGVMLDAPHLFPIVQRQADRYTLAQLSRPLPLTLSSLDEMAAARGAATFILDEQYEHGLADRLTATTRTSRHNRPSK